VPGTTGQGPFKLLNMCKATKRFRLVEVDVDSTSKQEFTLKDEEVLREAKKIVGIEAYKVGTVSITPSQRAVVNDTVFNKSFLTLTSGANDEVITEIPFADLNKAANNGQLFMVDIPPLVPSKCKIVVGTVAALSASETFLLGFHYES
jgi:hypothetical protein